ncbi:NAD(P)H-quinone oxidoreductase subunit O, chloroplastic isoform X2 [Pistacia vera]|uniref:NAD(P)H-quinone oxidoreductase subunit O, chloroplastic isoform X2 n=1 Tax=Pistacia vera TaxID=55513 RepID=UPI00126366D8|nr:NAD(P)H-quinone oxidoreductase subunit O, chloroplastic isoform X2 [Pistacia vera]
MAFSSTFSPTQSSFSCLSQFPQPSRKNPLRFSSLRPIKAAAEPPKETPPPPKTDGKDPTSSTTAVKPAAAAPKRPKKPVYSMKKGQIVRVDKEKYLNSINYLSVGHPPFYKGLDYIYEDRGEVAWVGIPTAPAWLPTDMLIESDKLDYERL